MSLSLFASISLIHLVALMSPGPDFFFVTRTAMSQSRSKAMMGVLGITGGIFIWAGISILGLHILFEQMAWLQRAISVAGGLYLLWMGYGLLRSSLRPQPAEQHEVGSKHAAPVMRSPFLYGLFTNLANPKAVIYFASIFSSFITPQVSVLSKAALFCFVVVESFLWFAFVATVFGLDRPRSLYRKAGRWIDAIAGTLFGLFGAVLIYAQI